MKYVKATAQVVRFDNSDVITTSGVKPCTGVINYFGDGECNWSSSMWDEGGEQPGEF